MKINTEWKDYEIIATGNGMKLERWKNVVLLRPDPQVIWKESFNLERYPELSARYKREGGGGEWENLQNFPSEWKISWRNLKFVVKPMGFKHTGLFPEQAVNWDMMIDLIKASGRKIKVLNLFAYTGGATLACASAGASVVHVDSAKSMVERAKENLSLSGMADAPVRFIIDDCKKFIQREIKRGNKYDAIIMDPPSYGRGPNGEMWKIENDLFDFLAICKKVLSESPLFVLINSYTTGLQPIVLSNLLKLTFGKDKKVESYELGLPTKEDIILPCGASGVCLF